MAAVEYRKLQGMELKFVAGRLEENRAERAIGYSVTFDMTLDFTHFVQMANVYIPGYLNSPINAIRPDLLGLAYHDSYNYFSEAPGPIHSSEALSAVFTKDRNYLDVWSSGEMDQRYGKPEFAFVNGALRITARAYFRWEDPARQIEIADLPTVSFQWALNLMGGHTKAGDVLAPSSVVILMYAHEDLVEVDGLQLFRGMRYMKGRELGFGPISSGHILTAG
ncbi:hypothetical protein [Pseudomonas nunensis]|uniref:hypothetical protein n=1 Tax=Pseudomonas nunensis TaxID=2961896 RepID=UPI0006B55DD5|nr:hypothetical protein [Pseudomonas nunensis]KOY01501.1 hypothetical protein AM274_15345 [Pseudomonas nunensis]